MADKTIPTPQELRQLLRYEPETGKFYWLPRNGATRGERFFNTRFAGKEALTADNKGYRVGRFHNQDVKAHRVAWAIHYGAWPDGFIDHIDHDRANNRIDNLRIVDATGNGRNVAGWKSNTSGALGVGWVKARSKWRAMIRLGDKSHYIGLFKDFEDAVAARRQAEAQYGFHENHGRE